MCLKQILLTFSFLGALLVVKSASAEHPSTPSALLASAHGLEAWPTVERIDFTFHVNRTPPVVRTWSWDLINKQATRSINGKSKTIDLESITTEADKKIHSQFINDTFWFIFPFVIKWSDPTVTDHGMVDITIRGTPTNARKLTALWPNEGGYTPGDAYDLFVDEDYTILGWTFRRENKKEGRFFAWQETTELGPIQVYQAFTPEGADQPLIRFKDLAIKLEGDQ